VLVGYGGTTAALSGVLNAGWKYGAQPRRLLSFALDGRDSLPPSVPRDFTVNAVDDPSLMLDEKVVAEGRALSVMCIACHGADLVGAGSPGPDLRESRLALSAESLWSVLHDGSLAPRGMPAFPMLSRAQVNSLQAAIRAAARESLGTRNPGEQGGIPRS
jgi:quinohemoprotein ethanol dehydrogenase